MPAIGLKPKPDRLIPPKNALRRLLIKGSTIVILMIICSIARMI
jgi:hypothetical protein